MCVGVYLLEPPQGANGMPPHGWLRVVGPTGSSADQGGRPATQWRQPPPTTRCGPSWASSCLNAGVEPVLSGCGLVLGLLLVHLSLNQCSDIFCDFMSGQNVLAICILAQKHNLHFLEGKVWFKDFIGSRCVYEMQTHDFLIKLTPRNGCW